MWVWMAVAFMTAISAWLWLATHRGHHHHPTHTNKGDQQQGHPSTGGDQ